MQTKFSIISNIIFKYFLIFAIVLLWLNFYIEDLLIVGIISLIVSIITGRLIAVIQNKKNNVLQISLKEQDKIKNISYQLFLTQKENIIRFYSILLKPKHNAEINKDKQSIIWQNTIFVPEYNHHNITADTISNIYKNYSTYNKIIIAGISFNEDAIELAKSIAGQKIILLDQQLTFKLFKKYDFYPDFKITANKKEKFKFKNLKNIAFVKTNSKHYFLSGIIILITSLFIKYNIYYLIFATILFIFSGICRFKKYTPPSDIIDEI